MKEEQQRKNRLIALLSTTGIHGLILLLMFFIIAWKAPNPPLGEAGVDLNLGLDFEGSGDIQPEEPVGGTHQSNIEKVEESKPEPQQPPEEVKESVKPTEAKADEEKVVTGNDEESTVVVKEKKEEVKPVEKPKEKVEEKPIAVYKPTNNPTKTDDNNTNAANKIGKPGNQGDDQNKVGDKGDPRGTVEGKAMYGDPGNGGGGTGTGPSLEIAGWKWDEKPHPTVPANESGRVVFEIKVDDNGDVISIKTLERSISAEAEQACKKTIERLSFTKTGANVPSVSTGKITFVVRAR